MNFDVKEWSGVSWLLFLVIASISKTVVLGWIAGYIIASLVGDSISRKVITSGNEKFAKKHNLGYDKSTDTFFIKKP